MSLIDLKNIRIDPVSSFYKFHTTVDVLRLDLLHPVVSGNKWFKLMPYIGEATRLQRKTIVTFGGAFSNHILATAAASRSYGLKSVGIIRGEEPRKLSFTLEDARTYGMELFFISREDYKQKKLPEQLFNICNKEDIYLIDEGGYGQKALEGVQNILQLADTSVYTHIVTAVGTGTTLAGLAQACNEEQEIIGISVLKNHFSLQQEIEKLLAPAKKDSFSLIHDHHFGGYAKYTDALIAFMNEWYKFTGIPSDFVYTGKLFYAINDMIEKNYFSLQNKLLLIHSGGLQGNRSLPNGTLIF